MVNMENVHIYLPFEVGSICRSNLDWSLLEILLTSKSYAENKPCELLNAHGLDIPQW